MLPDLGQVSFHGISGQLLLALGLIICALGLVFGLVIFYQIRKLPVHKSMREISELIWQTCKTYLTQQGRFLILLWVFIAIVIGVYFGLLNTPESGSTGLRVIVILLFSIIGILGSYGVAWFGIRINTYANSRTAFESLRGKPFGIHAIPMRSGMSVGMMLISVELIIMLIILLWIPRDYAGRLLHRFCHRRVAGRRRPEDRGRHLHQDRRYRLRSHEDRLQHQRRRRPQPGRDRGLHRRQRRRLRGSERRRLRDLRRDRRGPHHLHHPGGGGAPHPGLAPSVDLRHARDDDRLERRFVLPQRRRSKGPLQERRQDELRGSLDVSGVGHLDHLHDPHLRGVLPADRGEHRGGPGASRLLVDALHHHQHGDPGRRRDPRIGEGVHLHQVGTRERGGEVRQRRRGFARHPLRLCGRQLTAPTI